MSHSYVAWQVVTVANYLCSSSFGFLHVDDSIFRPDVEISVIWFGCGLFVLSCDVKEVTLHGC